MLHIVLYHPEIPPNTGNVARLCAATATPLNLIEPLGFSLDDRYLKRAGLDYWKSVPLTVWKNLDSYLEQNPGRRLVMTSARRGQALQHFSFTPEDSLIFGPETTGLPPDVMSLSDSHVRIPTLNTVRSLNLSTCAGIVLYQALFCTGQAEAWG